jgi:tetratricopeptide (TPR) repeat protein
MRIALCLYLLFCCGFVFAQQVITNEETSLYTTLKKKYALAIDINDKAVAKDALVQMLAIQPSDTITLYKLLEIYFETKEYDISYQLSKKYLTEYRNNVTLLDFFSQSSELLHKYPEALAGYEKIYLITNDIYYQYYAANAEYIMGNYNDCMKRTEECLKKKLAEGILKVVVTFEIGNGQTQQVDIFAAFQNMKGMLLTKTGRNSEAIACYKKALELEPNFILAQENMRLLPADIK